ncbi:MAG: glycosyltransferase family 39 protein [Candidatus Omnitrophica bacterium]|nr:glycosyltransferase family 39 protein [Candidatus Omnitrophota bacterium]MDE2223196.1 glycosyltransferase family 39 protein [Candidatus Omnitrophota bacterium]
MISRFIGNYRRCKYPPLFPIILYIVHFFTGDFIAAIQYINIFSISLCLIPLYFLVKNMLNVYSALCAVFFTSCFFAFYACAFLWPDYFFSLLIITICWLVWNALTRQRAKTVKFFLAGILNGTGPADTSPMPRTASGASKENLSRPWIGMKTASPSIRKWSLNP